MSENSLLTELEWRGLISQTTDRQELSEALDKKPLTLYVGFDPTAPSLHVGNLVVLLALRRFQMAGQANRIGWWRYWLGGGSKWKIR